MSNFSDLKFVLLQIPNGLDYVPRVLLEQIPSREWEVETFLKWSPIFIASPLNRFWVLVDNEYAIKGLLWITIDPILKRACVNIFSVLKEYQHPRGEAIKEACKFLKKWIADVNKSCGFGLKDKLLWTTTRPKAFKKIGATEYPRTIMEI